jgi:MoaA/NifB/PqqE/SkfB family radical SAM enzyme
VFAKTIDFVENRTTRRIRSRNLYSRIFASVNLYSRKLILDTFNKNKLLLPCLGGKKLIVLSEVGDIFPCELLKIKMGNVRESNYDMRSILFSQSAKEVLTYIKDSKCFCTIECNMVTSIIYNWRKYPQIIQGMLKLK